METSAIAQIRRVRQENSAAPSAFLAVLLLGSWLTGAATALAADTLVATGSVWKYRDNGSDQGTAWRSAAFDDIGWATGRAQLGYGDGDEITRVGFGTNANDKFITTWFRQTFSVTDPARYTELTVRLLRDDGAVVYLNGREVFRSNMPQGPITFRTLASANVGAPEESTFYSTTISATNLAVGPNLLAVEVHQAATNSTDLSFDLELLGVRPPVAVTLNSPAHGAWGVRNSPVLSATVSNPSGSNLTVTYFGRVAGSPAGPDFTIIAIPDTQYYVSSKNGGVPATFTAQTDWIVANKAARNIVFVTHLGDCVENGDNGGNTAEWRTATNAMYRLEDPATTFLQHGIPYGIAVGNHDQSVISNTVVNTRFFNEFFGEDHFAGRGYYGGHFGTNNNNHFELFSASGLDFITVHLDYAVTPDPAVLAWANALLQTHSNRRAILVSHYIINAGNPATFGPQGQAIYSALRTNANLFLMLSGHVSPEEGRREDTFNGHTVYSLMSDYQSRVNGGNGWLRLLEFSPANNVIRVKTFSPTLNQFETDADSEFTLSWDMQPGAAPFTAIGTIPDVPPGTTLSPVWPGLADGTAYEWSVTVTDGLTTSSSPARRFQTGTNQPPSAILLRPSNLAQFIAPAAITMEAAAADSDGAISQVEFFAGSTRLGSVTTAPYTFTWNNIPAGAYTLTAVAWDNAGLHTTTAPVTITVVSVAVPQPEFVAAPAHLTAALDSTNHLVLQWTDNSANEQGFAVDCSTNGVNFLRMAVIGANTTAWADASVRPGQTYFYRVCALGISTNSDFSNTATISTTPAPAAHPLQISQHFDRAAQTLSLTWLNTPGTVYRVVFKESIDQPAWTDLTGNITADGSTAAWEIPVNIAVPHRFFAVKVVP